MNHKDSPKVSFLMSIRHCSERLEDCLESLVFQTYANYNIVIVLDNAERQVHKVVKAYAALYSKILVIENPRPRNLATSLNYGLNYCDGDWIARIDADDVSNPDRLKIQVDFALKNGDSFAVIAARAKGIPWKAHKLPHYELSSKDFFRSNPIVHPSVMIRKQILKEYRYTESFKFSQDYKLWTRIIRRYRMAIINQELIEYNVRKREPNYVLSQESYFLLANLTFLLKKFFEAIKWGEKREIVLSLFLNINSSFNLAKNYVRVLLQRF